MLLNNTVSLYSPLVQHLCRFHSLNSWCLIQLTHTRTHTPSTPLTDLSDVLEFGSEDYDSVSATHDTIYDSPNTALQNQSRPPTYVPPHYGQVGVVCPAGSLDP